jgi:hypothetical protein
MDSLGQWIFQIAMHISIEIHTKAFLLLMWLQQWKNHSKRKHHLFKKNKIKNVFNFTTLLIFIFIATPLMVPTTSTYKKNKTNIRLAPKVSHLHKPKLFPLLFHKSPNIQLSDKRQNRRLFLTLKFKQAHHLSHHKL